MRVAVVGGGISGLAAAHRLTVAKERGDELGVELFDAGRLGGAIGTETIGDYGVVEHGADMFITDKPAALALCKRLGLEPELVATNTRNRRSLVLSHGRPVEVPEGFMLMAPSLLRPMVTTPLLSVAGKARAAADLVLPRGGAAVGGDESIGAFVRRRFGRELLDRLVQPLVGGIYTGDPDQLSLRATLPRFVDMERAHRSVTLATVRRAAKGKAAESQGSGARYGLFVSLRGGMRTLVETLEKRAAVTLRRQQVMALTRQDGGFRVTAGGGTSDFDALVVALPAFAAAELCVALSADMAAHLSRIPYASTAIVVSGHAFADVAHPLDAFGLVIPHVEGRRVLAVSMASRKLEGRAPAGHVLLRTFVGGALQPELFELSDARIEALVLDELGDLFGVGGRPDFVRVVRHARAMPQYLVGHLDRVAAIEREAAKIPAFALCGNAYRGVGIPDCIASAEAAAESVWQELRRAAEQVR